MRMLLALPLLAACSNAANPAVDAPPSHGGIDAAPATDAIDAAPVALRILVVNEVAAGETPDWFEVVNATTAPVEMSGFVFVDKVGDLTKAVPFAAHTLGPGEFFQQPVDGTTVPFKLASDEELWLYRAADQALSDGVDWAEGASPTGSSYARNPDVFGVFATTAHQTPGAANQF